MRSIKADIVVVFFFKVLTVTYDILCGNDPACRQLKTRQMSEEGYLVAIVIYSSYISCTVHTHTSRS